MQEGNKLVAMHGMSRFSFPNLARMLNPGADPRVNIQIDGHIYSVQRLLQEAKENQGLLFSDDIPPEVFALSNVIEKTLNENVGMQQVSVYDDRKKSKMKQLRSWMKGFKSRNVLATSHKRRSSVPIFKVALRFCDLRGV